MAFLVRALLSTGGALLAVALLSAPALAVNPDNNGNHNGQDNGNGHQTDHDNGNHNGEDNGNAHGEDNEHGNGNPRDDTGNGNPVPVTPVQPATTPATPASSGQQQRANEQDQALQAVEDARAMPLEQLADRVRAEHPGDIIDARLVTAGNFLLYEIKVFEGGRVATLYYYARSGLEVR